MNYRGAIGDADSDLRRGGRFDRAWIAALIAGLGLGAGVLDTHAAEPDTRRERTETGGNGWRYTADPDSDTGAEPERSTSDGIGWRYTGLPDGEAASGPDGARGAADAQTQTRQSEAPPAGRGQEPAAGQAIPPVARAATPAESRSRPSRAAPGQFEELLLTVELNRQETTQTVLALRDGAGRVLLSAGDFDELGLRVPEAEAVVHDDTAYHPIEGLDDVTRNIDMRTLVLSIDAPPAAMQGHRLSGDDSDYVPPDEPATGVFMNHDLVATAADSETNANGILEVGAFGTPGSLRSSQVIRDLGDDPEVTRLETTWRKDFPESMQSLRVGDAVGFPGSWGRPVRFGGVQWGTNFATRPDFVTFPLPSMKGETALPSTVDVYIDNTLRFSRRIPAGPFTIDHVPAVTGSGDIELVVRDILGRERTIVQPYYASSRLLRDGLHEYSYELGSERELFGEQSAEYGRVFGTLTHRLGLTDYVTGELRTEVVEADQQTVGFAVSALWPATGVWSLHLAGSRRGDESGGLVSAGFERQGRRFGIGTQLRFTEESFTQIGLAPDASAPGRTIRLFASTRISRSGSAAISYVDRFNRDDDDVRFAQASVSWGFSDLGYLRVAALYPWQDDDDPTFTLSFSSLLGGSHSLHTQATTSSGETTGEVQLQKNTPRGPGSGYAVAGAVGANERVHGRYTRNATHGRYSLEAESVNGNEALRAGVEGSVAWVGGRPMLARDLGDAFAVVEVPGQAGLDVYRDNQIIGRTGSDGRAIVHGLLPYDRNSIRIDATQLPLDVEPGKTQWRIVPSHGSAVRVRAEAKRTNGAVFRILGEDGEPLPAGAVIGREDIEGSFPVGYDGLAYVTGLEDTTQLYAQWDGRTCTFELNYPDTGEPLPDLGDIVCRQENSP